ncbi:hypothetical protein BDZ91DRAFT_762754 [Kalaharituber pfeilii]|nr:hypothetical protein BDZ91DRAFT_762754 [Kalaharituber pfeilii]
MRGLVTSILIRLERSVPLGLNYKHAWIMFIDSKDCEQCHAEELSKQAVSTYANQTSLWSADTRMKHYCKQRSHNWSLKRTFSNGPAHTARNQIEQRHITEHKTNRFSTPHHDPLTMLHTPTHHPALPAPTADCRPVVRKRKLYVFSNLRRERSIKIPHANLDAFFEQFPGAGMTATKV